MSPIGVQLVTDDISMSFSKTTSPASFCQREVFVPLLTAFAKLTKSVAVLIPPLASTSFASCITSMLEEILYSELENVIFPVRSSPVSLARMVKACVVVTSARVPL